MLSKLKKYFHDKTKKSYAPIDPDEIFLDSQNLPRFNRDQFEGRIEKPITRHVFSVLAFFLILFFLIFIGKIWFLQIKQGAAYETKSENNSLRDVTIFADRGLILDRNGTPLVWNTINPATTDFSLRVYATSTGLSTLLGYIEYPTKDSSGFYWLDEFTPKDGLEKVYNTQLSGVDGSKITETDAKGNVVSESVVRPPQNGNNVTLSIDAGVQKKLYESMLDIAARAGFKGGAGIIMDIRTGEILASATFPE